MNKLDWFFRTAAGRAFSAAIGHSSSGRHQSWIQRPAFLATAAIGVALTLGATWQYHQVQEEQAEARLAQLSRNTMAGLAQAIESQRAFLQSVGTYVAGTDTVKRPEFQSFVERIRSGRGEATIGVAWLPRVADSERTAFRSRMQLAGFSDFNLQAFAEGEWQSAGERDNYFPLAFRVGTVPDAFAPLGADIASNPAWAEGLTKARDQAKTWAAAPFDLEGRLVAPVFQPVYQRGAPSKVASRRTAHTGYVVALIDLPALVQVSAGSGIENVALDVVAHAGGESHAVFGALDQGMGARYERTFDFMGQRWVAHAQPEEGKVAAVWAGPLLLFAGGTTVSLLLGAYLAAVRGRTEVVEAEVEQRTKELRESQSMLIQQEKMASLGQMVAGVAHEMNTPLGYVRSSLNSLNQDVEEVRSGVEPLLDGQAELPEEVAQRLGQLQEDDVLGEIDELVANARQGIDRVTGLVSSLRDFSRKDHQAVEAFDVNRGCAEALEVAGHRIKKAGVEIEQDLREVPTIQASPSQINQVLLNLIVNAVQASPPQGTVAVRTRAGDDGGVVITVADNGPGIPPEVRPHIFDPFYTTKDVGEGTGLGLSISFQIVQAHGGTIQVHDGEPQGAVFEVILPAVPPEAQEQAIA